MSICTGFRRGAGSARVRETDDYSSLAAQSIVAPMASLTLVANVIFAPLIHGERVTRGMLGWTGVIIMGCALSVVFAQHQDCRTRAACPGPAGPQRPDMDAFPRSCAPQGTRWTSSSRFT